MPGRRRDVSRLSLRTTMVCFRIFRLGLRRGIYILLDKRGMGKVGKLGVSGLD